MQEELYISLLQKRLSGSLTSDEQSSLDDWLAQSTGNQHIARQVQQAWEVSGGFSQEIELDVDADFDRLERRIAAAETSHPKVVPLRPRQRWLAIAAAVLLLVAAPFVLRKFMSSDAPMETVATSDSPTLQPMSLADGSRVWLNGQSTLRYFTSADGNERRVELSGEAFFEVAKDPAKPFIVTTSLGEVTVLGTSFNVRNPPGSTTLEVNVSTGKVRLQPTGASNHLLLVANETGIFEQTENRLTKTGGAANNSAAWHTNKLVFDNAPLEEALQQLSALHGVSLSAENEAVRRCTLTVTFDKMPLETALETLKTMFGTEIVKVSDKEFRLTGGRCG